MKHDNNSLRKRLLRSEYTRRNLDSMLVYLATSYDNARTLLDGCYNVIRNMGIREVRFSNNDGDFTSMRF